MNVSTLRVMWDNLRSALGDDVIGTPGDAVAAAFDRAQLVAERLLGGLSLATRQEAIGRAMASKGGLQVVDAFVELALEGMRPEQLRIATYALAVCIVVADADRSTLAASLRRIVELDDVHLRAIAELHRADVAIEAPVREHLRAVGMFHLDAPTMLGRVFNEALRGEE